MPSVLCIKRIIMTNLNRCENHIIVIDYTYITKYNFYLTIMYFLKYIFKHQYIIIFFSIKI